MTHAIDWHGLLGVAICALVFWTCIKTGEWVERRRQHRALAAIRTRTLATISDHQEAVARLR